VEDFIKDVDFNRVSSPLAQAAFATGEILMMSTDLLSMNYEGARDGRWSVSAARLAGPKRRSQRPSAKEQSSCGWRLKEKPGGSPSRARLTHRKHNGCRVYAPLAAAERSDRELSLPDGRPTRQKSAAACSYPDRA
jgi:hypothetical protein